jgi:hypothetical protein
MSVAVALQGHEQKKTSQEDTRCLASIPDSSTATKKQIRASDIRRFDLVCPAFLWSLRSEPKATPQIELVQNLAFTYAKWPRGGRNENKMATKVRKL